jgi:hypothetical protein
MDDAGATHPADAFEIRTVMQERIDQRASRSSCSRVHHHPGRFIDNDTIVIFVEDTQRQLFGFQRALLGRQTLDLHEIIDFYPHTRLRSVAVERNFACDNEPLYFGSAEPVGL